MGGITDVQLGKGAYHLENFHIERYVWEFIFTAVLFDSYR